MTTDTVPPWLAEMRAIMGTKETAGSGDNPTILAWRDFIAERFPEMAAYCRIYAKDSIAWCGLTVAYVMARCGIRPVFGPTDTDKFLYARAWTKCGTKLDKPKLGCVMVFTRAGGGHVALYEGEEGSNYLVRGGNQSDAVTLTKMPKSQFVGAYWPAGAVASAEPSQPVRFRALVAGGYFSSTPFDMSMKASIRCNNPGAINASPWIKAYPGYVGDKVTSMSGASANNTAIFEAPEYGVAVWWELMSRYRAAGAKTVAQIINRYGGGQNYSAYVDFVASYAGLPSNFEVKLSGDDASLLRFAKAMFRYEAGRETPLSEAQILYGFELGRKKGQGAGSAIAVGSGAATGVVAATAGLPWWAVALMVAAALVGGFAVYRVYQRSKATTEPAK